MTTKLDPQEQARVLSEALPHMQRYDEEIIVIKYGGHAMGNEEVARAFARDMCAHHVEDGSAPSSSLHARKEKLWR